MLELASTSEAASILDVTETTIRRMVRDRTLSPVAFIGKAKRQPLFYRADAHALAEKRRVAAQAKATARVAA